MNILRHSAVVGIMAFGMGLVIITGGIDLSVGSMLALGIRNIRLGPTLPPFLSPVIVAALQQKYDLKAVTTPENDLQAILGRH